MANPTFLFMNPASMTYTGSGAGFANLNDYVFTNGWTSGTGSAEYLQLDLGSSRKVTHVAMSGMNVPSVTKAAISGSNYADFSSGVVIMTANDLTLVSRISAAGTGSFLYALPTTASVRYVRLSLPDDPDPMQEATVGAFWAGEALVLDTPFDVPSRTENAEYKTFEGVSLNGNIRSSQVYSGGRIVNEVRFSLQSDATANLIRAFVQTVRGKRYPFFFAEDTDTNDPARLMHFADDYVPVETVRYNLNSVAMKMRTHHSEF